MFRIRIWSFLLNLLFFSFGNQCVCLDIFGSCNIHVYYLALNCLSNDPINGTHLRTQFPFPPILRFTPLLTMNSLWQFPETLPVQILHCRIGESMPYARLSFAERSISFVPITRNKREFHVCLIWAQFFYIIMEFAILCTNKNNLTD